MASYVQMLTRIEKATGIRATDYSNDSTHGEVTLSVQAINNSYLRALLESECTYTTATYSFTASSDFYDLSAIAPSALAIKRLSYDDGQGERELVHKSESEIVDARRDGSASVGQDLMYYSVIGSNKIMFYPNPSVGDSITIMYIKEPSDLISATPTASAGVSATPSAIPTAWQWDVLTTGAIIEVLEKEGRYDKLEYWQQAYSSHMNRFLNWLNRFGGDPTPVYNRDGNGTVGYPDIRGRY